MSSETREVGSIPASPPQPANTLLQMMTSYWVAQAIYVAASLGLADHLAGGPMTCEDLAAATQSHAPSLRRLLRVRQLEVHPMAQLVSHRQHVVHVVGEVHHDVWVGIAGYG